MALEFLARFPDQTVSSLPVYVLQEPDVFPDSSAVLGTVARRIGLSGRPTETRIDDDWTTYLEGLFDLRIHRRSGGVMIRHTERYHFQGERPFQLSDDEAERVARGFLERSELVPLDEAVSLRVTHLRTGGREVDGGEVEETLIDAGVVYGRVFKEVPVYGPGGTAMVNIDAEGEIAGCRAVWRPVVETVGEVEILRPDRAYEVMERIAGGIRGDVRVTKASFGYFEQGIADRQRFLQPAYIMAYVVQDDEVAHKAAEVVAASERVFEPFLSEKRHPATPQRPR